MRTRVGVVVAVVLALGAWTFGQNKSPEEILKSKGLVKNWPLYLLAEESAIGEELKLLRIARKKMEDEQQKQGEVEKQVRAIKSQLSQCQNEDVRLHQKLAEVDKEVAAIGRRNVVQYNQGVARHNELVALIRGNEARMKELGLRW